VPVKIMLKGHLVFLCCKDCVEMAQADPDKTLAKVKAKKRRRERSGTRKKVEAYLLPPTMARFVRLQNYLHHAARHVG